MSTGVASVAENVYKRQHQDHLDPEMVKATLGIVFKDRTDVEHIKDSLADFFDKVGVKIKEVPVK